MYALPRSNYPRRSSIVNGQKPAVLHHALTQGERIKQRLRSLGVSSWALRSAESRYLPHIIHEDEDIQGVVYGKSDDGFAMLIATDTRVIYLDKKPLFVIEDEITYDVISGVSRGQVGPGSTIKLHTRVKDYTIRTFNEKCSRGFAEAIEARCLGYRTNNTGGYGYDYHAKNWLL